MAGSTPYVGAARVGSPKLGVALTAILFVVYYGFISLGVFAPGVLATPIVSGGTVTVAFAYGLFVIALGVALTGLYAVIANQASR